MFSESKGKLYLCVIDQACSVKMAGVLMDRDEVEREICSRWRFSLGLPSIGWTVSIPYNCYAKGDKYQHGDKCGHEDKYGYGDKYEEVSD